MAAYSTFSTILLPKDAATMSHPPRRIRTVHPLSRSSGRNVFSPICHVRVHAILPFGRVFVVLPTATGPRSRSNGTECAIQRTDGT
ncbi:unnamed protein product [Spirodela intermedia]|uniref:Uncharacterized protein n=1 Tax=Spirodela intermedia TaxID=51605 RepID=A0A7I8IZB1_SPIIN|nr:unnamed protein product [Spirodela intermedia]CAA6663314.1 unnamed protein product [Spirodela intermedia]